jgi:hypothetical protein
VYRKEGEDLSLYNMLPFLEGWNQLSFAKTETVEKGRYVVVFSRAVKGWLLSLSLSSDDAYASLKLSYLGTTGVVIPHLFLQLGETLPPSMGSYILDYIRPSTLSTAGVYVTSIITSAYPFSVKGLVRLELGLEADSTQATTAVIASFLAIEITDEKAFIRSYRRFKYGWLGWTFDVLSRIPGLKYIGIPEEIKEVVE